MISDFQRIKLGHFPTPIEFLKNITKAFQRRFRQELINGIVDKECLNISENLVKKIY